ncbi:MAG: hypothetical protein QOI94_1434 [Acidobacteriaceae bacterium]|nr:hypothetical protein [Acidobacteriaceae bacterium]
MFEIVDGVPEFNDSALAVVCPCFSLVFPGESLYTNVLLRLIVAGTDGLEPATSAVTEWQGQRNQWRGCVRRYRWPVYLVHWSTEMYPSGNAWYRSSVPSFAAGNSGWQGI